jgi:hypothetical protein
MEKHELGLVTSTCTKYCNVLLHECTRCTRTLHLLTNVEAAVRQTSVVEAPIILKQLLGLRNSRLVSEHEVDVGMSFGKLVPLGRLQEVV